MKLSKIEPKPICKECGKEFKTFKGLHLHLRSHKMTMGDYYIKHFPKKIYTRVNLYLLKILVRLY